MITADKLNELTQLSRNRLSNILGTKGCNFNSARFLGITNGGQFCYSVTYTDSEEAGKVFVTYDQTTDRITADC